MEASEEAARGSGARTGGVAGGLTDALELDDAVDDVEDEALAAEVAEGALGARVRHGHAEGICELAPRVGEEGDHRARHLLVLCPSLHHRAIVHAVHENLVDACGLERRLRRKVPGHLHRGSAGRKRAREPENDLRAHEREQRADSIG
jgi:hypothetical protein